MKLTEQLKALEQQMPPTERECRDCGQPFRSTTLDTGTKWTSLCGWCLRNET